MTVKEEHILLTPSEDSLLSGVAYQDTRMRISFQDGNITVGFFCYSKQSPKSSDAFFELRRLKISDEDYGKSTDCTRSGTSPIVFYNTPVAENLMKTVITRYGANEQER